MQNKQEPFSINGHYPLYYQSSTAQLISPISSTQEFEFGGQSYYMPSGISEQFLGDYDDWIEFRKNDNSFDNMIKDWKNDIESGIETTFVAENTVPLSISIDFSILEE